MRRTRWDSSAFEHGALLIDNRGAMTPVVELRGRGSGSAPSRRSGRRPLDPPGEAVALLGPNGAGKTTTISLMLGLRRPTSGSARLFGLDPTDRRARSRCGVMLQESGVMGVLTVARPSDLFRSYYPCPLPTGGVALAGLEEVGASGQRLSGGQRQRLYFALASAAIPKRSSSTSHRGHGRRGAARLARRHPRGLQCWQDDRADHALPGRGRSARRAHRRHRPRHRDRRHIAAGAQGAGPEQAVNFSSRAFLGADDQRTAGQSVSAPGSTSGCSATSPRRSCAPCSSAAWPSPTWRSPGLTWKMPSSS